MNVTGELVAELMTESKAEFSVEVAETGETRDIHSGGVVVLRCKGGLAGGRPGGLHVLDNARRCDFKPLTAGSRA